jgi:cellulose synthase/poly-beta-1,6-N-acetylglucosamine synthase-like glycosyltransferase
MFNERLVAERVIQAACRIDYPRDLLQVQVLDDSTDASAEVARACCARLQAAGQDVQYIHRDDREGFKAGALAEGLKTATGRFIAVFDADFVPQPQVLHQMIHHFTDDSIGMVQARWSHLNRNDSLLTQVQAMYLDGHFVVEQAARALNSRWFNFNGTAGIWRRETIDDAGGWQHDTLTEDTDISYRAQLKGWKFRYLPDVCCPAEVPPTVSAFLGQQHRWNKGLIQTAIKLLPTILRSDVPLRTKIEAWFHLTSPLVHLFILLLVLLVLPAMFVPWPIRYANPAIGVSLGVLFMILGALAAAVFYLASQTSQGLSAWRTLLRLPALMAMGVGNSVVNSRAGIEALYGRQSPFGRTPKDTGERDSEVDPVVRKHKRMIPNGLLEVLLGITMIVSLALAVLKPHTIVAIPFLMLFACGYLAIGIPALRSSLSKPRPIEEVSPKPLAA